MSSDDEEFNPDNLEAKEAKEEYDSDPSDTGEYCLYWVQIGIYRILNLRVCLQWLGQISVEKEQNFVLFAYEQ